MGSDWSQTFRERDIKEGDVLTSSSFLSITEERVQNKDSIKSWLIDICEELDVQYSAENIEYSISKCVDNRKQFDITKFHTSLAYALDTQNKKKAKQANAESYKRKYNVCGSTATFTLSIGIDKNVYIIGNKSLLVLNRTTPKIPKKLNPLRNILELSCSTHQAIFLDYFGYVWIAKAEEFEYFYPRIIWGIPRMISVACGAHHACCISIEFKLWSFGQGVYGQLGHGTKEDEPAPREVPNLENIQIVQCGGRHTVIVSKQGTVLACGSNHLGQLGFKSETTTQSVFAEVKLPESFVKSVSCGKDFTVFLLENGKVFSCGNNLSAQLGLGTSDIGHQKPQEVKELPCINEVVSLDARSYCVDHEGNLWGFGSRRNAETYLGDSYSPVMLELHEIQWVAQGDGSHCIAKDKNNKIWGFGENGRGQLSFSKKRLVTSPTCFPGEYSHIFGDCYSLSSVYHQIRNRESYNEDEVTIAKSLEQFYLASSTESMELLHRVMEKLCTDYPDEYWPRNMIYHVLFVFLTELNYPTSRENLSVIIQTLYDKNFNEKEKFRIQELLVVLKQTIPSVRLHASIVLSTGKMRKQKISRTPTRIAIGADAFFIDSYKELWCIQYESLIDHSNIGKLSPINFDGVANVVEVSCGKYHTLALDDFGKVWSFGTNFHGQLGRGDKAHGFPAVIDGIPPIAMVDCGPTSSAVVSECGKLFTFGQSEENWLGPAKERILENFVPTVVEGLPIVRSVACGSGHTIVLCVGGSLFSQGQNKRNQTGHQSPDEILGFCEIVRESNVVAIACGNYNSAFLLDDGTVAQCGHRAASTPTRDVGETNLRIIPELSDIQQIQCNEHQTLCLDSAGKLWIVTQEGVNGEILPEQLSVSVLSTGFQEKTVVRDGSGCLWLCDGNCPNASTKLPDNIFHISAPQ